MRAAKTALPFALAIAVAASAGPCRSVASLYPLFTDNDLILEPALLGTWLAFDEKDTVRYVFTPGDSTAPRTYVLTMSGGDEQARFTARLGRIDDQLILDLVPFDDDDVAAPGFEGFVVPVHIITRLDVARDSLWYAYLGGDWFRDVHDSTPGAIRHETVVRPDSARQHTVTYLLTAPAPDLQRFLSTRALPDARAFEKQGPLIRGPKP